MAVVLNIYVQGVCHQTRYLCDVFSKVLAIRLGIQYRLCTDSTQLYIGLNFSLVVT